VTATELDPAPEDILAQPPATGSRLLSRLARLTRLNRLAGLPHMGWLTGLGRLGLPGHVGRWELDADTLHWVRVGAIAVWVEVAIFFYLHDGVPVDRESLILWIMTGLIAASIGRRPLLTVVFDWVPFALVLIVYDYMRGASQYFGGRTLWTPQIAIDKWFFFGHEPTVWLQEHLKAPSARWWDVVTSTTYTSFFILPYVIAGFFWLRSRREFHRWAARFVVMSFLGLAGFILFPAAPPWAAAKCTAAQVANHPSNPSCINGPAVSSGGLLGRFRPVHHGAASYVERISGRGFDDLHLTIAHALLDKGQATVDQVAAIPSLHAGITLLLVLFLWRRCHPIVRALLALYALTMAFALIYTAEHYFFDVLMGWTLAVLVTVSFGWWERRQGRLEASRREVIEPDERADTLRVRATVPLENLCPPIETTPS
jgi:membrane-associated phospholipid phosphatase